MTSAFHLGPHGDEEPEKPFDPIEAVRDFGDVPVPIPLELKVSDEVKGDSEAIKDTHIRTDQIVTGINPKDAIGATKVDLSVVPPSAELHLAAAMMDGAVKYGPFNWRDNPVLARVYIAAARRHLLQFLDGEDFDPISHVHHLGHAMACCAILLDAAETGCLDDNRPKKGVAGSMIRRFDKDNKFS